MRHTLSAIARMILCAAGFVMSIYGSVEVVGLAAGGVIGSGWLLAVPGLHESLGEGALLGWAAGGVLMLTIAVVMVEFGLISQRTGGLLFHPHDAFGPLVVIILAASLWISYAIDPAAQAAAAVNGLFLAAIAHTSHVGAHTLVAMDCRRHSLMCSHG